MPVQQKCVGFIEADKFCWGKERKTAINGEILFRGSVHYGTNEECEAVRNRSCNLTEPRSTAVRLLGP